jgi:hypothetical protein
MLPVLSGSQNFQTEVDEISIQIDLKPRHLSRMIEAALSRTESMFPVQPRRFGGAGVERNLAQPWKAR